MEYLEQIIATYGYIGIIIILMGGIIGLPIPDEVLLTFIGYYIYKEKFTYFLAFSSAFLGSILGISISYILGSKLGLPFLEKYGPKFHFSRKRIVYAQYLFHRFGPILLFVGFFIPGIRHISGYLSGIAQYRFIKFAIFTYTGAFLWVFTFLYLGIKFGHRWTIIEDYISRYSIYLFLLLILLLLLYYGINKWRFQHRKNR